MHDDDNNADENDSNITVGAVKVGYKKQDSPPPPNPFVNHAFPAHPALCGLVVEFHDWGFKDTSREEVTRW